MIEPSQLVDRIVVLLQSIQDLAAAVGGPQNIRAHYDAYPVQSLGDAVYEMTPPGILVVWDGTSPAGMGTREVWQHQFRLILRAKTESVAGWAPNGYYRLWKLIVDGVPEAGDGSKMRMIEPMFGVYQIGQMSINRSQLLVDPSTNSVLEFFEVRFALREKGDF